MTTIQEDKLEQRQKIFCLQNLFYRVYPIMNVVRERRRWRYQLHRQRPPMVSEIRVGWRVATISLSTHDSLPDTTHLCPCDHTWPAKKSSRGDQNKNRFTGIHFQFLKFVVSLPRAHFPTTPTTTNVRYVHDLCFSHYQTGTSVGDLHPLTKT